MIHPNDKTSFISRTDLSKLPMNLIKDEVAHDGHPSEAGQEEEDIAMSQDETQATEGVDVIAMDLDDCQDKEGHQQGAGEIQHNLVVVRSKQIFVIL